MKKFVTGVFYVILASVAIGYLVPKVSQLYLQHVVSNTNPNTLNSLNSSVQISYNLIYLLIAIVVTFVAYNQLSKSREATTIQTLSDIDFKMRSDGFVIKRRRLAEFVIEKKTEEILIFLKSIKTKKKLDEQENEKVAEIKNIFEDVIYQFEFIGYYYRKKIFEIEDIYQLFSVELQLYWLLMDDLGFIEYLRENKANPNKDYYDKFEILFRDTVKQEIINESNFLKLFWRVYYWYGIYRIFYCIFSGRKNEIQSLIHQKKNAITLFLIEERKLRTDDYTKTN